MSGIDVVPGQTYKLVASVRSQAAFGVVLSGPDLPELTIDVGPLDFVPPPGYTSATPFLAVGIAWAAEDWAPDQRPMDWAPDGCWATSPYDEDEACNEPAIDELGLCAVHRERFCP